MSADKKTVSRVDDKAMEEDKKIRDRQRVTHS
jgi:hypothetical protein